MRKLWIQNNRVGDITPLAALAELRWLKLNGNEISNIQPLAEHTHLSRLSIQNNYVDVSDTETDAILNALRIRGTVIFYSPQNDSFWATGE